MLQQLRVASKSWVASVIIGVLVLAFALWGVADIFRGGIDTVVADVGRQQISSYEYDLQLRSQLRALSAQTQTDFTMEQARQIGLDRSVLDQAINRAALDDQSLRLGLTASVEAIRNQIRNGAAFRDASGAFNPLAFQQALLESGMSEEGFINSTGADITRSQLLGATTNGFAPPPGLTRLLYDFVNEQRTIEYLVITPEEAGEVPPPSDADLEAFHKAHEQDFSAPEYRSFEFVDIGPEQVAEDVAISDAELRAEFEARRANYETPEQRDIEQIAFPSKEEADAAAARIMAPADFATVARERGLSEEDVKLGTFTAANMDAGLSQAAFALAEGAVTPPIEGPFGWVILRAAKVTPGETKTFEDVATEIRANLLSQRSEGRMTEFANEFEDARASGASISEAAMMVGLMVFKVEAADREGNTPNGGKAVVPADPLFLETVFQTDTGEDTDLSRTQDGHYYALQVTAVIPPAIKPLDSVREQVRSAFISDARQKLLDAKVGALVETAKREGSLVSAGRELGRAPVTSMPLRRGQTDTVFSTMLLGQLFAEPQGGIVSGPAGAGTGIVIARVTEVTHPEPDVASAEYTEFVRGAAQQLSASATDTLAAAARARAGVNIHEATVQQILGETVQ